MTTVALSCRFVRNLAIGSMLLAPLCLAQPAAAQTPPAVQWRVEDGGNGHWYQVLTLPAAVTLDTATFAAAALGAHVVSITSEGEQAFVRTVADVDSAWASAAVGPLIGLKVDAQGCDSGCWATGEGMEFAYWHPGNPDSVATDNCVYLYQRSSMRWQNHPCGCQCWGVYCKAAIIEWSADCNSDGIVDYGQILSGELADANANGVPDSCEQPTLLHRFTFDSDLTDSVGSASGTLLGAEVENGNLVGRGGYAEFDQYLVPTTTSATIALWIKPQIMPLSGVFISQGFGGLEAFFLGGDAGTNRLRAGDQWNQTDATYLNLEGSWHHIALVIDRESNATKLYVDGVLADELGQAIVILDDASGNPLGTKTRLCNQFCCDEFFYGSIDDVRIYGDALTGSQLAAVIGADDGTIDQDGDGVPDVIDNCPNIANTDQADCNADGVGNACDTSDCNGNGLSDACEIVYGTATDCDQNGILDSCDLQQGLAPDCNGNQLPDACDIASKVMEDCNANGIGDECEKQVDVVAVSPRFSPIGFGAPVHWDLANAVSAVGTVVVGVRVRGDIAAEAEWIDIVIGDSGSVSTTYRAFRGFYWCEGAECAACPCTDCLTGWDGFSVPQEAFNNAIRSDGTLQVRAVASIAVDAGHCFGDTWIEFELHYTGAAAPDCNANGLLDSCELAAGYAVDANGNGVIDDCEAPITQCPGDYDFDQAITGQDLSLLLAAWGTANQQVDLTGDGQVDGNDMAVLLAGWGTCAD